VKSENSKKARSSTVGPIKKTCRNFTVSAYRRIRGRDFHPESPEVTSSEKERRKVKSLLSGLWERRCEGWTFELAKGREVRSASA
jgi:hypothetical protein